jgi:diacylglycerol kinase (ATP)
VAIGVVLLLGWLQSPGVPGWLAIPQTSEAAAQLLVSPDAQIREVDVGQSGENHFLLRAFIGFDAQRIKLATREMRDRFGKAAYLISGLKAMPESRMVRYTVTLDGEEVTCEGFTCLVETAGSMGVRGLSLAPNISVSDGLLDVIIMHGLDPLSLASALGSIADKPLDPTKFHHWQAREFTIATDPPQTVIGDVEEWGETPITMKVLPGAARIIAPGGDRE